MALIEQWEQTVAPRGVTRWHAGHLRWRRLMITRSSTRHAATTFLHLEATIAAELAAHRPELERSSQNIQS